MGIGVSMFAHVVGAKSASWRSGVCDGILPCFKFSHVFNCPHLGGLIAISPYTCVFLNVRKYVNTCKYTKNITGMV